MKLFTVVAILIYTLLFSVAGAILIAMAIRPESLRSAIDLIRSTSFTTNVKVGLSVTGLLLILINILIAQLSIGKLQRQKIIAFENPGGQVTLSLSAVEDYIKKITDRMTEIKEIKSTIYARKSGVEVITRAALYSGVNIPEVTEKVQAMIRSHLQEMLGLDETITVKVHVARIVERDKKSEAKGASKEITPSGFKGEIQYGD